MGVYVIDCPKCGGKTTVMRSGDVCKRAECDFVFTDDVINDALIQRAEKRRLIDRARDRERNET